MDLKDVVDFKGRLEYEGWSTQWCGVEPEGTTVSTIRLTPIILADGINDTEDYVQKFNSAHPSLKFTTESEPRRPKPADLVMRMTEETLNSVLERLVVVRREGTQRAVELYRKHLEATESELFPSTGIPCEASLSNLHLPKVSIEAYPFVPAETFLQVSDHASVISF
ncbi:hypothetical protein SprV_0301035000 [Sparganum proliferum]